MTPFGMNLCSEIKLSWWAIWLTIMVGNLANHPFNSGSTERACITTEQWRNTREQLNLDFLRYNQFSIVFVIVRVRYPDHKSGHIYKYMIVVTIYAH